MRTATLVLSLLGAVAAVAAPSAALGEDPPPGGAQKPGAAWSTTELIGDIAVSRDGKWLAGHARAGFVLLPLAGGDPVVLDVGPAGFGGIRAEFTADSQWLVLPETGPAATTPTAKDTTQSVFVFPTAAPFKRRTIELKLKEEDLPKQVRKQIGSAIKRLTGTVRKLVPLGGARVLIDRGTLGVENWDVSALTKSAVPPVFSGADDLGLSDDGATCVRIVDAVLEIRDVRANRLLRKIEVPAYSESRVRASSPTFSADGAEVLVVRASPPEKPSGALRPEDEYRIDCWSAADGTKKWEAPLGSASYVDSVAACGPYLAVVLARRLHLLDLRDGREVAHAFSSKDVSKDVSCARPAADGAALWVILGAAVPERMALPALPEK